MNKQLLKTVAVTFAAALMLSGCTGQSVTYDASSVQVTDTPTATPTSTPTETPLPIVTATPTATPTIAPIAPIEITEVPDPDKGLKLIGEKAEGNSILKARLANVTGLTIAWFSVKDNFTDNFPANMLEEKGTIRNNETRVLYYDASHGMKESAEREEKAAYDIRIALKTNEQMEDEDSEGTYVILHDVPFSDFEEAQIYYDTEKGIPYLKYKSKATGAEVSTQQAETAIYEGSSESESASAEEEENTDTSGSGDEGGSGDAQTGGDRSDEEDNGNTADYTDNTDNNDTDEEYTVYDDEDEIIYYDDNGEVDYGDVVG